MDAEDWDRRYGAAAQVWSSTPNQFVEVELAGLPPGDAMDLACGEGRNAIWLAERGWRVTAVDFSAVAVERGRRTAGDELPIRWVVGDVLTCELPAVDLAVLAYLQLPAPQRRTALRRAFGALRPSGTLLVVAHDSSNLTEGTGGPQDPEVLYTADDVLADLAGEELTTLRAERVPRTVTSSDEHGADAHGVDAHGVDAHGVDAHGATEDRTAWDVLVRLVRR